MNFMGFLRLYRITGDKTLLRKVTGAWDDIHERQMYITGGVSVAEHYEHDNVKPLSGNLCFPPLCMQKRGKNSTSTNTYLRGIAEKTSPLKSPGTTRNQKICN